MLTQADHNTMGSHSKQHDGLNGAFPVIWAVEKMIRNREITLTLIIKLTLVKLAETSYSFGSYKTVFHSILVDPVWLLYLLSGLFAGDCNQTSHLLWIELWVNKLINPACHEMWKYNFHLFVWIKISQVSNLPLMIINTTVCLPLQAFWYYAMVRFRTIDLKSHPIAQFPKNHIIHKRTHKIHKIIGLSNRTICPEKIA